MVWLLVLTAYKSLQSRDETRNSAWLKEGWDSTVYYTGRTDNNTHVLPKKKSTI